MSQDGATVQLSAIEEVTWGVTPGGNFGIVRYTNEDFQQQQQVVQSQEINPDRQPSAPNRTDISARGGFGIEVSYGAHDDFWRGALAQAAYPTLINFTGTDLSLASGDNSLNSTTTDFTTENLVVGGWIGIRGFPTNGDVYARVVSVATNKVVLSHATVSTEGAGPSVTVKGQTIFTGTDKLSWTFEKAEQDISVWTRYQGWRVGQVSVAMSPQRILTGSFQGVAKREDVTDAAAYAPGYDAATTGEVGNAVETILALYEGGAAATRLSDIQFTLNNNLRAKTELGTLGAFDVGLGAISVTGSLQAYFANKTLYEKFSNFTTSGLAVVYEFVSGDAIVFDMPSLKYTAGSAPTRGSNVDVFADMQFEAFKDATLAQTFSFTRIPA